VILLAPRRGTTTGQSTPLNRYKNMESASNQASSAAKKHYLAAIGTSLFLSVMFWLILGVFQLVGFILWTFISALLGSSIGLVAGRKLFVTIIATALIRVIVFVIMTQFV